jgi:cell envelope opacity-associated protein A
MPIQLTAPSLQRTRVAPPVQKEEAAAQQAAVQEISNIPKRNRLVVPSVPCSAAAAIKKGKTSAKRWKYFNRQAARRDKKGH